MTKIDDLMCPSASPATKAKTGVRRVNNLPLYIAVGALALFVALIAMVAVKRSEQQVRVDTPVKIAATVDSSTMAAEIVAGRHGGIIPAFSQQPAMDVRVGIPVAMIDDPDSPPKPYVNSVPPVDPDLDRIKMEKIAQFEDAVRAKTLISLPDQLGKSHDRASATPLTEDETAIKLREVRRQIELMKSGDPTAAYLLRLQHMRAAISGDGVSADGLHPGLLGGDATGDRWALHSTVEAPRTSFELRAGAVVPGVMISGVKSMLPGQIIGQVSQNVYDTATGKYLLIPQGTRLVGVYSNDVAYGQDSLLIAWQRLVFPDGKALDIGSMPGADSAGFAGFRDQTDNHYARIFGSALLMSGVTAGVAYSQIQNQGAGPFSQPTAGSVMSAALGQELGQVTAQMIAKNLNIAPTLTIRPGFRFNIIVVKDLTFAKAYQSFDY